MSTLISIFTKINEIISDIRVENLKIIIKILHLLFEKGINTILHKILQNYFIHILNFVQTLWTKQKYTQNS